MGGILGPPGRQSLVRGIVHDYECAPLIDSGASQNVVNVNLLDPNSNLFRYIQKRKKPTTMRLTGVGGKPTPCGGKVSLLIRIGGHCWRDEFYLLPTCPHSVIIGYPSCRNQGLLMDAAQDRLKFSTGEFVDILKEVEVAKNHEREQQASMFRQLSPVLKKIKNSKGKKSVRWRDQETPPLQSSGYYDALEHEDPLSEFTFFELDPVWRPTPVVSKVFMMKPRFERGASSNKDSASVSGAPLRGVTNV
jgi:hypothetical protein